MMGEGSATGNPHVYGMATLDTAYTLVNLASTNDTAATSSSNHPVLLFPGVCTISRLSGVFFFFLKSEDIMSCQFSLLNGCKTEELWNNYVLCLSVHFYVPSL